MKYKTWLKISFYSIMFGWFPFMWVCGWGVWQSAEIRIAIMMIGLSVCLVGSMLMLPIIRNSNLFKSIEELENERIKYFETRKRLEQKINEL
jgi:thiosulfate reductase cytochrome b subunit